MYFHSKPDENKDFDYRSAEWGSNNHDQETPDCILSLENMLRAGFLQKEQNYVSYRFLVKCLLSEMSSQIDQSKTKRDYTDCPTFLFCLHLSTLEANSLQTEEEKLAR